MPERRKPGTGTPLSDMGSTPALAERRQENYHPGNLDYADMIRQLLELGLNTHFNRGPNGQSDVPLFMQGPGMDRPAPNPSLIGQRVNFTLPFGRNPTTIEDPSTFPQLGDIELPSERGKPQRRKPQVPNAR